MDSKYEAHKLVLQAVSEGLPALIVNPTFMIGPYDSAPSSGAMVLAVYDGKIPFSAPGGRNYICAKDAAVGIANALNRGRIGESYILGNINMTYKEAFETIASVIGARAPRWVMPGSIILTYGWLSSLLTGIFGTRPKVSFPMARIACDSHFFTAEKAVRELELPQSPIEDGIKDCFDWFSNNGYINKNV